MDNVTSTVVVSNSVIGSKPDTMLARCPMYSFSGAKPPSLGKYRRLGLSSSTGGRTGQLKKSRSATP